MKALFIFIGFLFLAVLARNAIARKDPGEYWQHVMKDEPMPEFIQGLVGASKVTCTDNDSHKNNKGHFHISSQKTSPDPLPSATAYTDDVKPENEKYFMKDQLKPMYNTPVYRNNRHFHISQEKTSFDPIPSVTAYTDDVKPENDHKHFLKDQLKPMSNTPFYRNNRHYHISPEKTSLDPFPSVTAYTDNVKPESDQRFTKEFEPSPNVSAYTNDFKPEGENMFTKEFEPSPNVSAYTAGAKTEGDKIFTKEFEPSPNISAYNDGIFELKVEK